MLKQFTKIFSIGLALAIVSLAGSIFINAVVAAWTGPDEAPPDGNVSNLVIEDTDVSLADLTLTGTNLYINQTDNARLYADAKKGLQIRIDSDQTTSADSATFAINNGDNTEIFVIDESGNITAKSDYLPTSDKHLATKDYVDAAAGGSGDATLENQTDIMGSEFDVSNDSLNQISTKIDNIVTGDASYQKQLDIEESLLEGNWVETGKTFYSVGGNTYFCKQHVVNGSGQVTSSNINEGLACRSGNSCGSGSCGSAILLSYLGTNHTNADCASAGGTIFNTGTSGTLCKFFAGYADVSCPSGWSQADYWQTYNRSSFGDNDSDWCGNTDTAPVTFSNASALDYEPGAYVGTGSQSCGYGSYYYFRFWAGLLNPNYYYVDYYEKILVVNPTAGRYEIGCK